MKGELSVAQKAAKDKLENPTVDADGQHLMTVEESRIITRVNLLAAKLGVAAKSGDENLSPEALTSALIERASKAGKTSQEIEDALKD
jgi:transcriptional/translational regulatory protein YebC/TACO1|tara:strand:+ start:430 stop:693 length:264 start_codon:yes stop_codon:yes gene_type:complete